jgi:hypothetical protein
MYLSEFQREVVCFQQPLRPVKIILVHYGTQVDFTPPTTVPPTGNRAFWTQILHVHGHQLSGNGNTAL